MSRFVAATTSAVATAEYGADGPNAKGKKAANELTGALASFLYELEAQAACSLYTPQSRAQKQRAEAQKRLSDVMAELARLQTKKR